MADKAIINLQFPCEISSNINAPIITPYNFPIPTKLFIITIPFPRFSVGVTSEYIVVEIGNENPYINPYKNLKVINHSAEFTVMNNKANNP